MASPLNAFNFLVEFGNGNINAGFSEVSGLGLEITVAEYRNGNDARNVVTKVPGMAKQSDVTLKRGLVKERDAMYQMFKDLQDGKVETAKQTVTVTLMDETGANAVQKWLLLDAFPIKYTGPSLSAKGGGDVAIEELTLSVGDIQFDPVT
ncbi:MAG: phage tail protein [Alphaproteobacteria bacterium]|nr:phage tail protein [Alphaproteobacteria bacterium]